MPVVICPSEQTRVRSVAKRGGFSANTRQLWWTIPMRARCIAAFDDPAMQRAATPAPSLARVDVNLGYLALRQGRYGAAVDLLRGAADVFDSLRNVPLAIATRLDLADAYLALNLLDEAGALSHEQLRLAEEVGLDNEHARALFY